MILMMMNTMKTRAKKKKKSMKKSMMVKKNKKKRRSTSKMEMMMVNVWNDGCGYGADAAAYESDDDCDAGVCRSSFYDCYAMT